MPISDEPINSIKALRSDQIIKEKSKCYTKSPQNNYEYSLHNKTQSSVVENNVELKKIQLNCCRRLIQL